MKNTYCIWIHRIFSWECYHSFYPKSNLSHKSVIWRRQWKLISNLRLTKGEVTRMKAYSAFPQKFQYSLDFNSENCIFLESTDNRIVYLLYWPLFVAWTDLLQSVEFFQLRWQFLYKLMIIRFGMYSTRKPECQINPQTWEINEETWETNPGQSRSIT